ncbi:hypothetical protein AVME950_00520 [Acidovorax sp. SUPP950]|uniref:hypothetical protein n=1 Tax=Acidovorax sp. SUPP950 TaxID=511901 RepID=UPI0023C678D0|nr:hypothetical protein [Acidovorax sp. SUPP950]GKS73322.1 hypothetical protein AVME950_00520 [Acidovorax sp. SUPP950]
MAKISQIVEIIPQVLRNTSDYTASRVSLTIRPMRSLVLILATQVVVFSLSGCAAKQREGLQVVTAENAHEVVLFKTVHFAGVTVGAGSTSWYHGLAPGRYKVEATDDEGDYYAGDGSLLIFGASLTADGEVLEPRTLGGFWLARSPLAQPAFKLYRINPKNSDGSERQMSWQLGLIPYAIDNLTGNRIGIGVWSWQFVPMLHRDDDVDRLIDAARPSK